MGINEREKVAHAILNRQHLINEKRKKERLEKEKTLMEANNQKVSDKFTEVDSQTAFDKLTDAAWQYDHTGGNTIGLDAFDAKYMPAHILKV
jgi:hypothetical protein